MDRMEKMVWMGVAEGDRVVGDGEVWMKMLVMVVVVVVMVVLVVER
jgi:hypothetical protein